MKSDKEIVGTLLGFDDFVSILNDNYDLHRVCMCSCILDSMGWDYYGLYLCSTLTCHLQDMVLEDVTEL